MVDGVKGTLALGLDLNYDTLLVPALDEVSSSYGLLAEVSFSEDFSAISYRLRADAKWHDGTSITPEDVIFSFATFKKLSPQATANFRHIVKVQKSGAREVTFTVDRPGDRGLPQVLEPPLGSGPYRIREFTPGRSIVYERVHDYWGHAINVNIGRNNFDELRFEYFRDGTAALEAFKADAIDWRIENSAKDWATAYDFPAVADKRVLLEEFPINNVGVMQAFAFNTRRDKFRDPRVRLAFNYAFDFEEMNRQIFYGQYKRITSYFEGTDLASSGLPTDRELELLETVRDKFLPRSLPRPILIR